MWPKILIFYVPLDLGLRENFVRGSNYAKVEPLRRKEEYIYSFQLWIKTPHNNINIKIDYRNFK